MKRALPLLVLTASGVIMIANFYIQYKPLNNLGKGLLNWGIVIAAFSLGLGAVNLIQTKVKNVASNKDVVCSLATIVAFAVMAVAGIVTDQKGEMYTFLFKNMLQPLGDTVFALLAFYIASASYRAFRFKTFETAVLLVSALIMLLGNTPLMGLVSKQLPNWANWVLTTPTVAARRAITVSAAIGALAAALRAFLGLETRITR